MFYRPKVIRCRLKTGGKSIKQIKESHKGQGLVYRDFESLQQMYDAFSGLIVELSLWEYDNHESYHLESWNEGIARHYGSSLQWKRHAF